MAEASQVGARILKELRKGRSWSWQEQARLLKRLAQQHGVERIAAATTASISRTIARWESGRYAYKPDERYQLLLAYAYATRDGEPAVAPGADLDRLMVALGEMGVSLDRRQVLRTLATTTATVGTGALLAFLAPDLQGRLRRALESPDQLDLETVQGLQQAVTELQRQREDALPFVRLQTALSPTVHVLRRLLRGRQEPAVRRALCMVAAQAFTLAGRLSFELHDDEDATARYDEGLRAARELEDGSITAITLTSRSMVTLYATSDVDAGLRIADSAVRRAHTGGDRAVRARALAVQAEMHARKGDERRSLRALDLARVHLAGDLGSRTFDGARLDGFEGICHLWLGRHGVAGAKLRRSVDALDGTRDGVQKSIVLADLSLAHLREGDPETACHVLGDCVELVARTRGRVAGQRLHRVRRDLQPWRTERFVEELDDRMLDAFA
jgi:hypothetical protein